MTTTHSIGVFALALLAIGCASTPPTPPPAPYLQAAPYVGTNGAQLARAKGYALKQAGSVLAIDAVSGSSARDLTYFGIAHVFDASYGSAWAPGAADANPSLTFDLAGLPTLVGFALKLSLGERGSPADHRVAVDVWTSPDNGTSWTHAASGLTPAEATQAAYALPAGPATHVRLGFATTAGAVADLRVCDVALYGEGSGRDDP